MTSPKPGANWLPKPRGLPPTVAQRYFGNYVSQRDLATLISFCFIPTGWSGESIELPLCLWGPRQARPQEADLPVLKYHALWRRRQRAAAGRPLCTEAPGKRSNLSRALPRSRRELEPPRPLGVAGAGKLRREAEGPRVGFPHRPRPTSERRAPGFNASTSGLSPTRECPFYRVRV